MGATETDLDRAALRELSASFGGDLVRPGDPGYDEHRRVWNGSIDRRPALIARCAGGPDVVAAIGVRAGGGAPGPGPGGGHSFPGHSVCDAGIVIDLRPMSEIRVDPDRRTATAQA